MQILSTSLSTWWERYKYYNIKNNIMEKLKANLLIISPSIYSNIGLDDLSLALL